VPACAQPVATRLEPRRVAQSLIMDIQPTGGVVGDRFLSVRTRPAGPLA
jgi:hypothetical protein